MAGSILCVAARASILYGGGNALVILKVDGDWDAPLHIGVWTAIQEARAFSILTTKMSDWLQWLMMLRIPLSAQRPGKLYSDCSP